MGGDFFICSSGGKATGLRVFDSAPYESNNSSDVSGSDDVEGISVRQDCDEEALLGTKTESWEFISTASSPSALEQVRLLHYIRKSS